MSVASPGRALRLAGLGLGIAYPAFAVTFRGTRRHFWQRMSWTAATLGGLALLGRPELRSERWHRQDLGLGAAIAAGMYVTFAVGDRAARRLMPKGDEEIQDIYALRQARPTPELLLRIALLIAPSEELFWRGLVQRDLAERYGPTQGALLATALYGGAHLGTGNATLVGAATVAGGAWSALARVGVPMPALVASHIIWDIWIFLIRPTGS